jgi:hypothetical protein
MEKLLKKDKHLLEPYYETPVTGQTLVPIDDDRAALPTGAASVFEVYA